MLREGEAEREGGIARGRESRDGRKIRQMWKRGVVVLSE